MCFMFRGYAADSLFRLARNFLAKNVRYILACLALIYLKYFSELYSLVLLFLNTPSAMLVPPNLGDNNYLLLSLFLP